MMKDYWPSSTGPQMVQCDYCGDKFDINDIEIVPKLVNSVMVNTVQCEEC